MKLHIQFGKHGPYGKNLEFQRRDLKTTFNDIDYYDLHRFHNFARCFSTDGGVSQVIVKYWYQDGNTHRLDNPAEITIWCGKKIKTIYKIHGKNVS